MIYVAQQIPDPVQPYGRSGSILLLNPTDRHTKDKFDREAWEFRTPEAIRGAPPEEPAPLP